MDFAQQIFQSYIVAEFKHKYQLSYELSVSLAQQIFQSYIVAEFKYKYQLSYELSVSPELHQGEKIKVDSNRNHWFKPCFSQWLRAEIIFLSTQV
jgi:hypothetical protein